MGKKKCIMRQAENPLAALLAGIPDFNTEDLEALLSDLPTQDEANEAAVMTMAGKRQGPDPCVCFRNQRGKKKALIGDLAGPCQSHMYPKERSLMPLAIIKINIQ